LCSQARLLRVENWRKCNCQRAWWMAGKQEVSQLANQGEG
jgi:hypothetical protein